MKAVIWTDVLQALVMLIGLLSAIIQGILRWLNRIRINHVFLGLIVLGGFGPTFSIASKGHRIQFNKYSSKICSLSVELSDISFV